MKDREYYGLRVPFTGDFTKEPLGFNLSPKVPVILPVDSTVGTGTRSVSRDCQLHPVEFICVK